MRVFKLLSFSSITSPCSPSAGNQLSYMLHPCIALTFADLRSKIIWNPETVLFFIVLFGGVDLESLTID